MDCSAIHCEMKARDASNAPRTAAGKSFGTPNFSPLQLLQKAYYEAIRDDFSPGRLADDDDDRTVHAVSESANSSIGSSTDVSDDNLSLSLSEAAEENLAESSLARGSVALCSDHLACPPVAVAQSHETWDVDETVGILKSCSHSAANKDKGTLVLLTLTSHPFRLIHITDVYLKKKFLGRPLSSCFSPTPSRTPFALSPHGALGGSVRWFNQDLGNPSIAHVVRSKKDGTASLAYYAIVLSPLL
jgi:hypothetical protein